MGQKGHLPKIFLGYPAMMKLSTLIPYLEKIQKIYKSRDTNLDRRFFTGNKQSLLCQEMQI